MNDNRKTLHQVWHKEQGGYVHALTVHANDLPAALVLPMVEPRSAAVSAHVENPRMTDVGDVIVTPGHDAYEVAATKHGVVFDLVDFAPARAALAAEQREEAMGGVWQWLRDGGRPDEVAREAAVYGIKPEEVAAARDRQEEGRER